MHKTIYQLISAIAASILILGSFTNVGASPTFVPQIAPNIFFVSAAGNDTTSCTQAAPCKSFSKASSLAQAGDVIQIVGVIPSITVTKSGIIIEGGTVDGIANKAANSAAVMILASNVTLRNMEVVNGWSYGIRTGAGKGDGLVVENVSIHNNVLENKSGSTCLQTNSSGWGSAFRAYYSSNVTVRNSRIYENCGEGFSSIMSRNVFGTGLEIYDNFSVNVYPDQTQGFTVTDSVISCIKPEYQRQPYSSRVLLLGAEKYSDITTNLLDGVSFERNKVFNCRGVGAYSETGSQWKNIRIVGNEFNNVSSPAIVSISGTNIVTSPNVSADSSSSTLPTQTIIPATSIQSQPDTILNTGQQTIEVRIAKGSDDVEESATGRMYLNSSDLELVYDNGNQIVGLRFAGVNIPKGVTITRAYIQFSVDEKSSKNTILSIQGEANPNAAIFTTKNQNVSLRVRTTKSVNWYPPSWQILGMMGSRQRTPDLAPIVQEIINQPGWLAGNSLVMIITGSGNRVAQAYEVNSAGAPLLHIEYKGAAELTNTPTPIATIVPTGSPTTVPVNTETIVPSPTFTPSLLISTPTASATVPATAQPTVSATLPGTINSPTPTVINNTYYVNGGSGNDLNPGTLSAPWQTLGKALSMLKAGDTLYLRGGEYAAPASGWQFTNGGVTLANYPNEQVILSSKNKTSGNYVIKCLLVSPAVDNVKIIGSDVGNQKGIVITGEALGIAPAIVGYQCDNWEIAGVEFRSVAYAIFQRKVNNGNTSADGWYVHDNFVNDYYRESGMQFNGNGNRIENNVIVKVTADSSTTYGCQLLNLLGNNNIVRGNHLERINQSVRCIGIFFEWDLADNNLIEGNTIAGVPNGISFFGGDNNIVRNNTLTGVDTAFVVRSWADGTTAYPCNFSSFMPLESDTANPDWAYYYPHDCRSKGNRFENNQVSGFATFSRIDLPEPSNVFINGTVTPVITSTIIPSVTPTVAPSVTPSVSPPLAGSSPRMLIPLYIYPSDPAWLAVVNANTYQNIDVIINPSNGPASAINQNYVAGVAQLRAGNVGVYGYVYTGWGGRSISIVKAEVDKWQSWYGVDGIFLDEASNKAAATPYFTELYDYITAKGMRVILNPGTQTIEGYMPITHSACIYETDANTSLSMPSWTTGYPASKFCVLQFGASAEQMRSFAQEAISKNIGYIYITNATSHYWSSIPPYLAEEAALLAGGDVTSTMTATGTNITFVTGNSPVITSNGSLSISENATLVTTITATDSDLPAQALTYSISGGVDSALFTINPTTGELAFTTAPDFEIPVDANLDNTYNVTIQTSDGSLATSQDITVSVKDIENK